MNKEKMALIFCVLTCLFIWITLLSGYTNTIDTSLPRGTDDPREADDNMRRIQAGFQEILAVEHNVDLTGTVITGDGKHTDITADLITLNSGGYFTDVIAKGPRHDIRAYLPSGYVTDGTVDYSSEIQVAIDAIKTVGSGCLYIPIGAYRVNTTLDCTGFLGAVGTTYKSLNIIGASMNGSRILGATSGTPIFDFTASGYCSIENLRITGHSSNSPNVAILLARNSAAGSAGNHNFRRIFVEGVYTKGGIYCFASETNVFDSIKITMNTGSTAAWCIAFTESNYESLTSAYETILAGTQSITRNTLLAPQLLMYDNEAAGTCLSIHGSVGDLDCYGGYMYSRAQSHVRMYSGVSTDTPYRISFRSLRGEGYATTSKPDYGIFMTGATTGAFADIRVEDAYIDAYTYEVYQDNTVSGTFSGVIDKVRSVNGLELKFNKVTGSLINVLVGDLTVDTSITRSEVNNYHTGTISLAGKDSVITRNFYTRLFQVNLLKRAGDILTLADEATPSVTTGNFFKTGGTANDPITDFDDGITGQSITIIAEHSVVIDVDAGNIFLSGATDWTMASGDTLTLICKADNKWYEISRGDNGA